MLERLRIALRGIAVDLLPREIVHLDERNRLISLNYTALLDRMDRDLWRDKGISRLLYSRGDAIALELQCEAWIGYA